MLTFIPPRTDPFLHRFMAACVGASIELAATARGVRYLTKDDIFTHRSCPEDTKSALNPLAIAVGGKTVIPDDLFGVAYPGPKYRFFAVEIDRNTESIERRSFGQSAYGRKLEAYLDIMLHRTYRTNWGLPGLMVLTVTTNITHRQHMIDHLAKLADPVLAQRFLFAAKPEFGSNWKVPEVMPDLFTEPWTRASGDTFAINQA
jgi:hypothetical protein